MSAPEIATDTADVIERAKAALEGVTPGPWAHRTAPHPDSGETPAEYLAGSLSSSGGPLHVLIADSPDPELAYVIPALTGDGPTSEINAEFIAAARTLVPELIAELARANHDRTMLRRQLDALFTTDIGELTTRLQEVEAERDHYQALCAAASDERRSLNLQLDQMRRGGVL